MYMPQTYEQLSENFPMCRATFCTIVSEIRNEIEAGRYSKCNLIDEKPVGIVSVLGSVISNLYVLPSEQNKGYGTQLLTFAVNHCSGIPTLWILSTNDGAKRLYERNGFQPTGNIIQHANDIFELELRMTKDFNRSSLTK